MLWCFGSGEHPQANDFSPKLASWWLNQPIWKICSSNWIISPRIGMNIKNVWNHHLASHILINLDLVTSSEAEFRLFQLWGHGHWCPPCRRWHRQPGAAPRKRRGLRAPHNAMAFCLGHSERDTVGRHFLLCCEGKVLEVGQGKVHRALQIKYMSEMLKSERFGESCYCSKQNQKSMFES